MDLNVSRDWFEKMAEREGDLEIGAGLMPREGSTPPAYGGCKCACHRIPGMKHVVACCHPSKEDEDIELTMFFARMRRARRNS